MVFSRERWFGAFSKKRNVFVAVLFALCLATVYVALELREVSPGVVAPRVSFEIKEGDGFREISARLKAEDLIRSGTAFELFALFTGSARKLQAGNYMLDAGMTSEEILAELVHGSHREVTVTIPEGFSMYAIERVLARAGVVREGELIKVVEAEHLEGKLFPDTYRFFTDSSVEDILAKFSENFKEKTASILSSDEKKFEEDLILASLVEREVPDFEDRRIVAGILKKRLAEGMPLQMDATICYIKEFRGYPELPNCYPLTPLDFKIDSAYNTYLYRGLPPGPIGNPGFLALKAVQESQSSPYWFYLSDPETKKTIFAKTLEEQSKNKALYLR
jgi:UPF0755 protein